MPRRSYVTTAVVVGIMFGALAASELVARAWIDVAGRVISADTTCQQPYDNRCVTRYVVERADGSRAVYDAGPNDHSLRRRLPLGTVLVKARWELSYSIDGNQVEDFPRYFYIAALTVAGSVAILSLTRQIMASRET